MFSDRKEYYIKNREKILEQSRQYYIKNKDKKKEYYKQWYRNNINKMRVLDRQWRERNPEKVRINYNRWSNKKYKMDPRFRLNNNTKRAIRGSLKGNKKCNYWESLVGYDVVKLKNHLKNTIPRGYVWQDYLKGKLQMDHIIPISAFNFDKPEHIDFKRCWALDNLRLLPAKENLNKHDKLKKLFQPALLMEIKK